MTDTEPQIDFAAIDYPTDKLTVKMMRQRFPHAFDTEPRPEWASLVTESRSRFRRMSMDNVFAHAIDNERQLAEWAFKKALGQPIEDVEFLRERREEIWEVLSNSYIKWGLARGEHEAHEMLRGIEAQAEAQARQHGGRPR